MEAGGRSVSGVVRSLSATGAALDINAPARAGDRITLSLRNIGDVCGTVIWVKHKRVGIVFDGLINPAIALAASPRPVIPTYAHVFDYKDHKRPGFGQQRIGRKT